MDLVVEAGAHVVVIEDKIHASEHSDQLKRYLKTIREEYPSKTILPVYLKTGEQSSYAAAKAAGWFLFRRRDLLAVLRSGKEHVRNDIFQDFVAHLESIEAEVSAFQRLPPRGWKHLAWQGFFDAVQTALKDGEWNYVPNANEGFMGFWWAWRPIRGGQLYLQLEQASLVAKIEADDRQTRAELRDRWSSMTVAKSAEPYLHVRSDGILDFEATIGLLRRATSEISTAGRRDG